MTKHNANNVRIKHKHKYFAYLKEAMRHSEPTVDGVAKALNRFEVYTKYKDFKAFHHQQAVAFKNHLAEQKGQQSGEKLSKATLHTTFTALKKFFQWLSREPGYKTRIQYFDAEYFNLSDKDTRIATAQREQRSPTLEQVKHVIATMSANTDIERRNRALIAFTLLTGARDSAIASMKLKHIDLQAGNVFQDAREVKTKFSKTFNTFFFPVGEEIRTIVSEWVLFLREYKLWSALTGALLRLFGRYFAKRLSMLACRTLIRTALERRSPSSARLSVRPRKNSRRGVKTSDMRGF